MEHIQKHKFASRAASPPHWIGIRQGWEADGVAPFDRLISLPIWRLRTHALVVGSTGSGKTTLLHHLIAQDVLAGHSFVVLDLRGDLVAASTEIAARAGISPERVRLLDLRRNAQATGFDPLCGQGEPYFRALAVLDAIESNWDSLGVQLAETLRNGLMLLAESGQPLTKLEALLYDTEFLAQCLDRCGSEPVRCFWSRFEAMPADRRNTLAMPVLNKVSALFATDTLRGVLGHASPIDLGAFLSVRGGVLLVSLAADELHASGRMMGRLILASVCREMFSRVDMAESRRNPVRLYVDEFEHFCSADFETILSEGRRFGLSLVIAHQTLAQLPPRMRSLVLGNVGVKVAFRCGREDGATLSKDMTGDAKALDLASLRTGQCVLWTKDGGPITVEVNQPIVSTAGGRSAAAKRLLEETATCRTHHVVRKEHPPVEAKPTSTRFTPNPSSMEDWLR